MRAYHEVQDQESGRRPITASSSAPGLRQRFQHRQLEPVRVRQTEVARAPGRIDRLGVEVLWQGGETTDLEKAAGQNSSDLLLQWIGKVSNAGWLTGHAQTNDEFRDDRAIVLIPN